MLDDFVMLSNINKDLLAIGSSAVELSKNILAGRPYGGTAILCQN